MDDERAQDFFELMGSARAMRYFRHDPVAPELVDKIIWAATRASNPSNTQRWDFVVVQSAETRTALAAAIGRPAEAWAGAPTSDDPTERRTLTGARHLLATLAEVPVFIFVCGQNDYPSGAPNERLMLSAIYAAGQNIVLAARALGLGTAFTTLHLRDEPAVRDILGLPDDRELGLMMPLGWPDREFGPVTRRPVHEVLHHERWLGERATGTRAGPGGPAV